MISDSKGKKVSLLLASVFIGSIIGGYAGEFLSGYKYFGILSRSMIVGFPHPVYLNLGIIKLMFDITITLNAGGIIGMILSVLFIKKVYNI